MSCYHALSDNSPYPKKISVIGWPDKSLVRPADGAAGDAARRIFRYLEENGGHPYLPPSPYEPRAGDIRLPKLTDDGEATPLPPTDPRPTYKTLRPCAINGMPIGEGVEVVYCGWPKDTALEPINDSAVRIKRFWVKYSHTGLLTGAPFDTRKTLINLPNITSLEMEAAKPPGVPPDIAARVSA